jgi:hypothetical protein
MDYEKAKRLMNFDHLFSALMSAKAFNIYKNSSIGNFSQLFLFDKPEPLLYYLRYLMIEIGLGGFVATRSVFEHLWGYEDDFLKNIVSEYRKNEF